MFKRVLHETMTYGNIEDKCPCGYKHGDVEDSASSILPLVLDAQHGGWTSQALWSLSRNVRVMYQRLQARKIEAQVVENPDLFNHIREFTIKYSDAHNLGSLISQQWDQLLVRDSFWFKVAVNGESVVALTFDEYSRFNLREKWTFAGHGNLEVLNRKLKFYPYLFANSLFDRRTARDCFEWLHSSGRLSATFNPSIDRMQKHLGVSTDLMIYSCAKAPDIPRACKQFASAVRFRTINLMLFKLMIVALNMAIADAQGFDGDLSVKILNVYRKWMYNSFNCFMDVTEIFVLNCISLVQDGVRLFGLFLKALDAVGPDLLAFVLLVWIGYFVYLLPALFRYIRGVFSYVCGKLYPRLSEGLYDGDLSTATVTGVYTDNRGSRVYSVTSGGKTFKIPEAPKGNQTVLEMSMPGSTLSATSFKPGVFALAVFDDLGVCELVGMGVRVGNYLVTAGHVANVIFSGIKRPSIVPFKTGIQPRLNLMKHVALAIDDFDPDSGVSFGQLDVFALGKTTEFWTSAGIQRVTYNRPSAYNQQISTVGVQNGILVGAVGKTLSGSGLSHLWHTASTKKGFSGGPVFAGTSMVGLHCCAQGEYNEAVRIEQIVHAIGETLEWSESLVFSDRTDVVKLGGREGRIEVDDNDHHWWVGSDGKVVALDEDYYQQKLHDNGRYEMDDYDEDDRRDADYDDVPTAEHDPYGDDPFLYKGKITTRNKVQAKEKKKRPALVMESNDASRPQVIGRDANIFERIERGNPVYCGPYPPSNSIAENMLGSVNEELLKLEFNPNAYGIPNITKEAEEVSLVKHLCLFEDRLGSIRAKPTTKEVGRVLILLEDMLKNNKFMPSADYKSRDYLRALIDSSLIKSSKSAGFPYGADGMATNGHVLASIGHDGVIDRTLADWDEPFDLKVFLKTEPHKRSKLDAGMLRIITCMPLHKMLKHQALFNELTAQAVKCWRTSPIVFMSPQVPGDVENIWRRFSGAVLETDKSNWDFNMFDYVYEIVISCIKNLAIQPPGMSDDDYSMYLTDVEKAVREVCYDSVYRCSNGARYQMKVGGIMKSGWVLTYFVNSLAQLVLHLLVSIRMGQSDDEILRSPIIVGGDDILQGLDKDFDVDRCLFEYDQLGVKVTQFRKHDSMHGAEFFSTKFLLNSKSGVLEYKPCRFTKHLFALKNTKSEDLCAALGSHMMNWCWDHGVYQVLKKMFAYLREHHPELVDESLCHPISYWRYKVKGYESVQ